MKKFILSFAVIAAIGFTSCSSDDDGGGDDGGGCKTCEIFTISSEYCDNGDGTMTVTVAGQEVEQDLEGVSFSDFIASLESAGATCD